MDPLGIIEQTWWLGLPIAFLMGVFLGLNPVALPMTGMAAGFGASGALGGGGGGVRLTAAFGAGMIAVYTVVGLLAERLDQLLEEVLRPYSGIGYVILGMLLLGFAAFLFLKPSGFCAACSKPFKRSPTMAGALMAGIPAGFVTCPACAAIVLAVAASAATLGNPLYSGSIMFSLGLGHVAVLVGAVWFVTKRWKPSNLALVIGQRVLAALMVALAVYFFYLASFYGLDPEEPRLP